MSLVVSPGKYRRHDGKIVTVVSHPHTVYCFEDEQGCTYRANGQMWLHNTSTEDLIERIEEEPIVSQTLIVKPTEKVVITQQLAEHFAKDSIFPTAGT